MVDGNILMIPVSIPAGATGLSGVIDLKGCQAFAIKMPAAWVSADITFQACERSGGTFYDLYDDNATTPVEVNLKVAQQKTYSLVRVSPHLAPLQYIKIRSGVSATPVNQTGAPTLYLLCKAH
jgi:hypothetical protein